MSQHIDSLFAGAGVSTGSSTGVNESVSLEEILPKENSNKEIPTKEIFYLTNVSYNEFKHEVWVEFSNERTRVIKREKFFPFILFSLVFEKEKLQELLLSLGFKGFSIEEENNLLCLKAVSFSELNKMANALALHTKKKPLVLNPERAFLIQKNWSFFDSFEMVGGIFYKFSHTEKAFGWGSFGVPDLGFFLTKEIPFPEAMRVNKEDALFLVELSAWSNLLSVPIDLVPKNPEEKLDLFLENIFFKHGELLSFSPSERIFSTKGFEPLGFGDSLSKIDFSMVWAELFSNNFFNIGPETRNCSCCIPVVLEAKNILPSSLIKVRFTDDNFFFDSCSESFAFDFHNTFPFMDQRLSKKKEFFLSSFPVGPFFRDDSALVPLMDALRLIGDSKAQLVSSKDSTVDFDSEENLAPDSKPVHDLNWFCLNKESFFSKEVRSANALLFSLRKLIGASEDSLFEECSFSHLYFKALYKSLSFSLTNLPSQLTNPNSKFFSTSLAKSIVSVQESTLAKFKEFSEKNGYRVLHANKNSAFVKGFSSLKLAKAFSVENQLPQPQIAGFSRKCAFGFV